MTAERRYLWIAVGVVVVIVAAAFGVSKLREELAPEPHSALVAIEVAGSGVAQVEDVKITAGERFTLHAVLVASDRQGEPVYYSQAHSLRIDGETVDPARLRVWERSGEIAVLWFTLEGFRPFMEVESVDQLEAFRFEAAFRPEWGRGWTVPGSVTPRSNALARGFEPDEEVLHGTARYQVRIEKYFRLSDPAPLARYRSPGAEQLSDQGSGPSSVVATLPAGLERVSAVFGTPQLEPVDGGSKELLSQLRRWYQRGLSFSRLLVLGGLLDDRGLSWGDLEWTQIDLELTPAWGDIGTGDLVRSGERMVVLYADVGMAGQLDYDDLCIDLDESAAVRRLGEVFTGGGVLDWADLDVEPGGEAE